MLWRWKYRVDGIGPDGQPKRVEKLLAPGAYRAVSLKAARDRRDAAREQLAAGIGPAAQKQRDKQAAKIGAANTFAAVAELFIEKCRRDGLADATVRIDGQQRLTTLQILLQAAMHALVLAGDRAEGEAAEAFKLAAGQISQLSRNQYAAHPDEAYKVWPTNDDRASFRRVMDCDAVAGVGQTSSRMADAYRFFKRSIITWLECDRPAQRALALAAALKDHLRQVVLDLDENDGNYILEKAEWHSYTIRDRPALFPVM